MGQNLVYMHPTISSLGHFISQLAHGDEQREAETVIAEMEALVEEFTQHFPLHVPSKPTPDTEVILVTGTTGSLGANILDKLVATPSVSRIYALNRRDQSGKSTLKGRQQQSFEEHGIDPAVFDSPKIVLLEGDTASANLGLSKEEYESIVGSVTSVIHNGV